MNSLGMQLITGIDLKDPMLLLPLASSTSPVFANIKIFACSIEKNGGTWMYMSRLIFDSFFLISTTDSLLDSRQGPNSRQDEYVVKRYKSHRKVGVGVIMEDVILGNKA